MYKIAICDDDSEYRMLIKRYVLEDKGIASNIEFYEYASGTGLIQDIVQMHDLIFLDIQMPGLDGNETAKQLRKRNERAVLVFCTSYHKPTPETIKVRPFRFIMKDMGDKNLRSELPDILVEMLKTADIQYLTVTGLDTMRRIPIKDILYISVIKRGSEISVYAGKQTVQIRCRESVRELYQILKDRGFEYAHDSYIVNLQNVMDREKKVVTLKDDTQLNIARSKKARFEVSLMDFFSGRRNQEI